MSEDFEHGLRDLYTRATAAHADGDGFPMASMVAVARRNRQRRTAAVAIATAAAVVGVGLGGAAAVRNLGDGDGVAPPAATETSTPTPASSSLSRELLCGDTVDDPAFDPRAAVEVDPATDVVPSGGSLAAQVTMVASDPPTTAFDLMALASIRYVAVQDGVVVGSGDDVVDLGAATELSGRQGITAPTTINLARCDDGTALPQGGYELYAQAVLAMEAGQGEPFVGGGGPWPLTITEELTEDEGTDPPASDDPTLADPQSITHEVSALFTEGAPLADGDYIANLIGVDPAAGTVDVDLMVWYSGQAAEDYVTANVPGGEFYDDYYLANDVETSTTLPIAAGAPVFEWCFGDDLTFFERTVGEWATAPTSWEGDVPPFQCSDGADILRGTLYWLAVRDGVVTQVVGQYTP